VQTSGEKESPENVAWVEKNSYADVQVVLGRSGGHPTISSLPGGAREPQGFGLNEIAAEIEVDAAGKIVTTYSAGEISTAALNCGSRRR
jgi:hypothetical protein